MKKVLFLLLFIGLSVFVVAQEQTRSDSVKTDTLRQVETYNDTTLIKSYAKRFDPRKALLYAAVLPGLGQIYNKKYWKLPLVYGGLFACGVAVKQYNDQYTEYRSMVYLALENGVPETGINPDIGMETTLSGYRIATDKARRQRDFFLIIMGGVYLLQIVDAHVDAHLKEFDLNPQLHVRLEPMMEQNYFAGRSTGMSLILRF